MEISDGIGTKVNKEGINYYNSLIDALLEKGKPPTVRVYFWNFKFRRPCHASLLLFS